MHSDPRHRLLFRILFVIWLLLIARAAQLQIFQHAHWTHEADIMRKDIEPMPARRGEIRSSDGQVLARSVLNWSLGVDPKMCRDPGVLALALDSLGLARPEEFIRRIQTHRQGRFLWISRDILPETPLNPLLKRFTCLTTRTEGKRLYPLGRAGGSAVGIVGRDELALGGLESAFDETLKGQEGRLLRISDASGTCFQGFRVQTLKEPVPGSDLETSIDSRLQEIASARLEAAVQREGASAGFCILTRPSTGEILAMVSYPAPDPADPASWNGNTLKVHPIADAYEPGSSFKLVAFSACIEAGRFNPEEPIDCMNGSRSVAGSRPITDHEPYGILKAWEVLAHSSNIGSGILAERVGEERFYRMEKAFGFGLPTGIQLQGEARGRIPEPSSPTWSKTRSLITMAFGQEVSCTGIQMAMAYGAVANGGTLMRPLLVRALRAPDGSITEKWDPEAVRTVVRPSSAAQMRELLRKVVTDGTGKKAEVPGFEPAGKTSTAQKFVREEMRYSSRRYIASFVGFAPYDRPRILCLVLLDDPTSSIYGGNVAAPLFREIVSDAIPVLNEGEPLASDAPIRVCGQERDPRREVPSVDGLSAALACRVVREAGFLVRPRGVGERVLRSIPASGERVLPGSVVTLELGSPAERPAQAENAEPIMSIPETQDPSLPAGPGAGTPGALAQGEGGEDGPSADPRAGASGVSPPSGAGAGVMPDLCGLCLRDALLRARSARVRTRVSGTGWVLSQYPDPGARLAPGGTCCLSLGPDSCRAYKEYLEVERRTALAASSGGLLVGSAR